MGVFCSIILSKNLTIRSVFETMNIINDVFPMNTAMTRLVCFLVFPNFELLDLSGPLTAFQFASMAAPDSYRVKVISKSGGSVKSCFGVDISTESLDNETPDSLIVIGSPAAASYVTDQEDINYFLKLSAGVRRIASVCTGIYLVAASGLLDKQRVTTHWRYASNLQMLYPNLRVDSDKIFIQDGSIWSSAGITAGMDLALALIEADLGIEVSRTVAREMVIPCRRLGGQTQFSTLLELESESNRIRDVLHFIRGHIHEPLTVIRLAEVARLSPRQFARIFALETGHTPAKIVERLRTELARPSVEESKEQFDSIARRFGFKDIERMRKSFIKFFGQSPQSLRRNALSKVNQM